MSYEYENTPTVSKIELNGNTKFIKDAEARNNLDSLLNDVNNKASKPIIIDCDISDYENKPNIIIALMALPDTNESFDVPDELVNLPLEILNITQNHSLYINQDIYFYLHGEDINGQNTTLNMLFPLNIFNVITGINGMTGVQGACTCSLGHYIVSGFPNSNSVNRFSWRISCLQPDVNTVWAGSYNGIALTLNHSVDDIWDSMCDTVDNMYLIDSAIGKHYLNISIDPNLYNITTALLPLTQLYAIGNSGSNILYFSGMVEQELWTVILKQNDENNNGQESIQLIKKSLNKIENSLIHPSVFKYEITAQEYKGTTLNWNDRTYLQVSSDGLPFNDFSAGYFIWQGTTLLNIGTIDFTLDDSLQLSYLGELTLNNQTIYLGVIPKYLNVDGNVKESNIAGLYLSYDGNLTDFAGLTFELYFIGEGLREADNFIKNDKYQESIYFSMEMLSNGASLISSTAKPQLNHNTTGYGEWLRISKKKLTNFSSLRVIAYKNGEINTEDFNSEKRQNGASSIFTQLLISPSSRQDFDYGSLWYVPPDPCSNCGGSGRVECEQCNGIGRVECEQCNGTGHIADEVCENCGGIGEVYCENCAGTGEVNCDLCGGSGYMGSGFSLLATDKSGTWANKSLFNNTSPSDVIITWEKELSVPVSYLSQDDEDILILNCGTSTENIEGYAPLADGEGF